MINVIFVHGTGGRSESYYTAFQEIEDQMKEYLPEATLVPCLWGDSLGAELKAKGASIPTYRKTEGGDMPTDGDSIARWKKIYKDPFYEMQILSFKPLQARSARPIAGQLTPSQKLQNRVEVLSNVVELQSKMNCLGIGSVFPNACEIIVGRDSKVFKRLLENASEPLDSYYLIIAKAIVAAARILCKEQRLYPRMLNNVDLRDQAVDAIHQALSQGEKSMGGTLDFDWIKKNVTSNIIQGYLSVFGLDTNHIKRKRGALMDEKFPFAGDIMVYQSKGNRIRELIRSQIESKKNEGPVILLAHSLGGIACVDLLIEHDLRDKVKCLITVGSQAPFLYEIDALHALSYGEPLPEHFPKWLNIYDLKDFLSYMGDCEGIFPGKLRDVEVNNNQPFPESHGAYWSNKQTWDVIKEYYYGCC
jgi:hypothetical protein